MRLLVYCVALAVLSACGGSSSAPANQAPEPAPLPRLTVGDKSIEFPRTMYEHKDGEDKYVFRFVTEHPESEFNEETGEVTVPPNAILIIFLKVPVDGFSKENIAAAQFMINEFPAPNDLHWDKDVVDSIKAISGKTMHGANFHLEFEWSDGDKSMSALVDGRIK